MKNDKGQVVLYRNRLEVRLEHETVWLTQQMMGELFQTTKQNISLHINNIIKENELVENSVVKEFLTTAADGKRYHVQYYNLDMIISVGYRVNSKRGTQFRIWATNILNKHLVNGYTINEKRLKAAENKYKELQSSLKLLGNVMSVESVSDEAKGLIQVITEYSRALDILDDYDHQRLLIPKGTHKTRFVMTYEVAREIIDAMKLKFKDSALVGQEKDESFKGTVGAICQTFGGKELYRTVEDKAAHLLYLITKNHSFVDGNKRIAASLFICFLEKNGLLLRRDGTRRMDNNALVALTLMIAASKPREKETMIKVILNLLQ